MSDDCISRQATLDAIDRWCMGEGDEGIYTIVENLPSVTPKNTVSAEAYKQVAKERDIAIQQLNELGYEFGEKIKTGHWIDDMRLGYHVSICSNCNWRGHGDTCLIYTPKYCPNCGAKMVEPQESEEEE